MNKPTGAKNVGKFHRFLMLMVPFFIKVIGSYLANPALLFVFFKVDNE